MEHLVVVPHAPPIEPGKFTLRAPSGLVVEVLHVLDGHVAVAVFWEDAPVAIYDEPAGKA